MAQQRSKMISIAVHGIADLGYLASDHTPHISEHSRSWSPSELVASHHIV
jgi:hypothetical protein